METQSAVEQLRRETQAWVARQRQRNEQAGTLLSQETLVWVERLWLGGGRLRFRFSTGGRSGVWYRARSGHSFLASDHELPEDARRYRRGDPEGEFLPLVARGRVSYTDDSLFIHETAPYRGGVEFGNRREFIGREDGLFCCAKQFQHILHDDREVPCTHVGASTEKYAYILRLHL